jgi:hypothetical protein
VRILPLADPGWAPIGQLLGPIAHRSFFLARASTTRWLATCGLSALLLQSSSRRFTEGRYPMALMMTSKKGATPQRHISLMNCPGRGRPLNGNVILYSMARVATLVSRGAFSAFAAHQHQKTGPFVFLPRTSSFHFGEFSHVCLIRRSLSCPMRTRSTLSTRPACICQFCCHISVCHCRMVRLFIALPRSRSRLLPTYYNGFLFILLLHVSELKGRWVTLGFRATGRSSSRGPPSRPQPRLSTPRGCTTEKQPRNG